MLNDKNEPVAFAGFLKIGNQPVVLLVAFFHITLALGTIQHNKMRFPVIKGIPEFVCRGLEESQKKGVWQRLVMIPEYRVYRDGFVREWFIYFEKSIPVGLFPAIFR